MKKSYLVKIVPPWGYRVFRLEFGPHHAMFGLAFALAVLGSIAGVYVYDIRHAEGKVVELRSLTDSQHERLQRIDAQAAELDTELRALEKQNDQIRKMIGDGGKVAPRITTQRTREERPALLASSNFGQVAERIDRLRANSARLRSEGDQLRNVTLHVLNMRRLEDLARARVLAAIPSINPAGTSGIASNFGWRIDPWPEFHQGVDLDANYGDTVRASAAGTIVAAGYDGGYGIKVDIDHGNGYHTWYCHLSRADVRPGQYVRKAQDIALVGSTGASTGPHLHYQIMLDDKPVDPVPYLSGIPGKVLAQLRTP